ncbi:MAG: serine hydrolase domain-containing protein [Clostridia bacterium]|nr:serine hydrolase domain-containing protein [Clostridia bacterium]
MKSHRLYSKRNLILFLSLIAVAIIIVIILLVPDKPPVKPEGISPGDYSYAIEYTEHQISTSMKKHNIPGIVCAVVDGNDILFSKAYGYADAENKTKTTADTIFKAGSISKVFTGIEVMRMHEEGLIDIDNPLKDYLPDFDINNRFEESGPITISSMLTHRSGLPRGGTLLLWDWSCRPLVLDAQMMSLSESHMVYPPDHRYKYSNIAYNTLARLIEVARDLETPPANTAGAFPYYMSENFFIPLGMDDTSFGSLMLMYGRQYTNPVAMGYYRNKSKNIPYNQFDIISMASGNVHTTLNDMTIFLKAILTAGDDGFMTKALLENMFFHKEDNSRDLKDLGLTWFRNSEALGETIVFHDGTNQGFISMLAFMPEHEIGMVIMANSDEFENVKSFMSFDILRVFLEAKTGIEINRTDKSNIIAVDSDSLEKYTGFYLMDDEIIEITLKNGTLKARYKGFGLKLQPIGENQFTFNNPLTDAIESRLTIMGGNAFESPYMILEMGDAFFCPRYPATDEIPDLWKELEGKYVVQARHPSSYSEEDTLGTSEIIIKNGILMMKDSFALLPTDGNRILIQGSVFHGETMEYDPDTGIITWQSRIYIPEQN